MNTATESKNPIVEKLVLTAEEVAAELGVSKLTVWRLEKKGLLQTIPGLRARYTAKSFRALCNGEVRVAS